MFKINKNLQGVQIGIYCSLNNIWIPLDPANSDYQQFKKHLAEGRELQDADGILLSTQAVAKFLEKLS
jgi:hypothetical protein